MKKTIRDHKDVNFARSLTEEKESKSLIRNKTRDRINQELSKEEKRQLALMKQADKLLRLAEELEASIYGFKNIKIFDLWKQEIKGAHDLYRKPVVNWAHNSMFDRSLDTSNIQAFDKRVSFNENTWFKRVSRLEAHNLIKEKNYNNEACWIDDSLMLPINQAHDSSLLKGKAIVMETTRYSNIKSKQEYQLEIKLFVVSGQYFITQAEKALKPKLQEIRELPTAPIMEPKKCDTWFKRCHISSRS